MQNDEYICALSGIAANEEQYIDGGDELEDLPVGWTKVTIQTRQLNPKYQLLLTTKEAMRKQAESGISDEVTGDEREIALASIALQVDAHFANIAAEISPFLIEESVTYVSHIEDNTELKEEWEKILRSIDLLE